MILKVIILFFAGFIGTWLLLWDFSDYLTQGLNEGIWDGAIIINGFPSIATGFIIVLICVILGVKFMIVK